MHVNVCIYATIEYILFVMLIIVVYVDAATPLEKIIRINLRLYISVD